MLNPEIYAFSTKSSLTLSASLYRSTHELKNQTILYFHGGGLIWGDRDDLPLAYLDLFLKAGYHVLTIDYPLAPETALPEIYESVVDAVKWFNQQFDTLLQLASNDYNLFGRSAGAYLSLLLGNEATLKNKPLKIISFYGYSSINEDFYLSPSSYYRQYPIMPESLISKLTQSGPLAKGLIEKRYSIYLYARQTGRWLDLLLPDKKNQMDFSLTDEQLALLPPIFIAQSKTDQDVPFQQGENLNRKVPNSKFVVIEDAIHNFDKDPTDETVLQVYRNVIDWLND